MRQHEHRKAEYMKQRMQLQAQQMAYGGGQAAVGFGASSAPHADGSSQQQQAIPAAAGAWNSGQSSGGDAYASQPANTAQQAGQAQPSGAPSAWNHTSAPNEQAGGYGQQAGCGQPSPYTWDAAQQKWVLSSEIAAAGGTATAGGYATQQTGQGQGGVAAEQYSWDPAQQKWVWGSGSHLAWSAWRPLHSLLLHRARIPIGIDPAPLRHVPGVTEGRSTSKKAAPESR